MRHERFEYVKKVVDYGLSVLLTGTAGTGKTTIAMQIAEDLKRPFSSMSLTKQSSMASIIGYKMMNGEYCASSFRTAYEEGHVFLLDELDAADSNVLLVLNTLENGFVAFPDKIVKGHKDFRLIATANPQDEHSIYTGRSKLDFSTMDRYYEIKLPRDPKLEENLTSSETVVQIAAARELLAEQGSSIQVTMRDAIRVHKLTGLGLDESPIEKVVFAKDSTLLNIYKQRAAEIAEKLEAKRLADEKKAKEDAKSQHDMVSLDTLWAKASQGK